MTSTRIKKLAIGTAQFGLDGYGVLNELDKVAKEDIQKIFDTAESYGINTIDTAIKYGNSEKSLGDSKLSNEWKVITKIPSLPHGCEDVGLWLEAMVESSLSNINTKCLYGLLLHNTSILSSNDGAVLFQSLKKIQEKGKVNKIGISIYDVAELEQLIEKYQFDLVQAPFNIIDRRLQNSGWLEKLKDFDIEVHVRSIFLQGLLLCKGDMPTQFNKWKKLWDDWSNWLKREQLNPLTVCLNHALQYSEIDRVIVGIANFEQFDEILNNINDMPIDVPDHIQSSDTALINPSFW